MLDVTEQLRRYGEAVEEAVLAREPGPRLRPRRRRLVMAAAAAVAVAVVAAGVVLARSDDVANRQVRSAEAPASPVVDSEAAQQLCEARGREAAGPDTTLRAAFESSRAEVESWQATRHGPGIWPVSEFVTKQPPVTRMVVCYFDGHWHVPTAPPPPGAEPSPPADRAIVLATADGAASDAIGSKNVLDLVRPTPQRDLSAIPAAAEYIGMIQNGDEVTVPEGSANLGGGTIGLHDRNPVFATLRVSTPTGELVLFRRLIREYPGTAWRIVDAIQVELPARQYVLQGCFRIGVQADDVVAVVDSAPGPQRRPAQQAWRFDAATERAMPIDPAGLICDAGQD